MLRLCLLLLFGAVHCVNAVEGDTQIVDHVARYEEGENAYQRFENFLALKDIALTNFKRQSRDVDDNIPKTSDEKSRKETDDVFGDDGPEPLNELVQHIMQDWEELMINGNIDDLVNKYTEDCVVFYHRNGKTEIHIGREDLRHAYEEWFNQDGVHSVTYVPKAEGRLGSEYLYFVFHITLFNENKNKIAGHTNLVIFKHIKHDNGKGGYEVQLASLIQD